MKSEKRQSVVSKRDRGKQEFPLGGLLLLLLLFFLNRLDMSGISFDQHQRATATTTNNKSRNQTFHHCNMRSVAGKDTCVHLLSNPWTLRCVVGLAIFASVGLLSLTSTPHQGGSLFDKKKKSSITTSEWEEEEEEDSHDDDLHMIYQGPPGEDRCFEEDTRDRFNNSAGAPSGKCICQDPVVPAPRRDEDWMKYHEILVEDVKRAAAASSSSSGGRDLDVLLLGDSITERWRGTYHYGTKPAPYDFQGVFGASFNRTAGGPLNGCAMGAAGDITSETLWHLQNGILQQKQQQTRDEVIVDPKLFFILIGTNDIGRSGCSKKSVLVGILNIADYLHHVRPNTPILFHGLLPRSDPDTGFPGRLGVFWRKIMWINREMNKFAKMHKNWYYMDSARLFLERNKTTGDMELNKDVIPDGLHPSFAGYQLWTPKIAENIAKILDKE